MPINPIEDQFREEVLRLFALEALEWMRKIKAALLELKNGAAPERADRLHEGILSDLTSLKGSASAVDLASVETLAASLLPLLQTLPGRSLVPSSEAFAALRLGVEALSSAIQVLAVAETKTSAVADLDSIARQHVDALQRAVAKAPTFPQASPAPAKAEEKPEAIRLAAIIESLLDLKRAPSASLQPIRNLVEVVLRKLHGIMDEDSATVSPPSVLRILQDLGSLDERFLEEARRRLPAITQVVEGLRSGESDPEAPTRNIQAALREIALLHETARRVDAVAIMQFLHGLETFLMDVAYKRVTVLPQRYEVVVSRLDTLLPMAQQWVEAGQAERARIEEALAHLIGPNLAITQQ
jgi:chemotaxis protein histidine kinase CheA